MVSRELSLWMPLPLICRFNDAERRYRCLKVTPILLAQSAFFDLGRVCDVDTIGFTGKEQELSKLRENNEHTRVLIAT